VRRQRDNVRRSGACPIALSSMARRSRFGRIVIPILPLCARKRTQRRHVSRRVRCSSPLKETIAAGAFLRSSWGSTAFSSANRYRPRVRSSLRKRARWAARGSSRSASAAPMKRALPELGENQKSRLLALASARPPRYPYRGGRGSGTSLNRVPQGAFFARCQ
jgi:hypothetical protein